MNPVKVGLLGLGTVGTGTARILDRNRAEICRRAGREITISRAVVRNLDRPNPTAIPLTTDPFAVLDDPEIALVVELVGGTDLAREWVLRAIANGKHVVTANKALIAHHGNELFAAAQQKGVMIAFEAAVCGGIPVIKAIREGLTGNRIKSVAGIINGTCNYILTAMEKAGQEFDEALAIAQGLGYAEADPSFDVDGVDAAHKLTILAAIAFGIPLQFDRVYIEGIRHLAREDVRYADELGYRIKSLGIARYTERGIEMRIHPTLIPQHRLLASVDDVMNAVQIDSDAVGTTLHCGAGAGAEPTGSSVVADIVDVVRVLTADPDHRVPHLAFQPNALSDWPVLAIDEVETAYYLRLRAVDKPGVMADVTRIMADAEISIEALLQKEPIPGQDEVPVIMLTQRVREKQMNRALAALAQLPSVRGEITRLRLETLAD